VGKQVESVAALIPTRNRPKELAVLLKSITESSILPKQVVIVASGIDVAPILHAFSQVLQITYRHTEQRGQIAQKRIGMELVWNDIEWCLFLDDDLVLEESAIELALNTVKLYGEEKVLGVGFNLPPTSRTLERSQRKQKLLEVLKLTSRHPGRVLSSGHAVSYLQENKVLETQWLNGASMWKTAHARSYGLNLPSTPYAACEDLIFSYPLSKLGRLLYAPQAIINFQDNETSNFDSFEVLRAASLWRYYFVTSHKELSFKRFMWSQIFRSIYAINREKDEKKRLFILLLILNLRIIKSKMQRVPPATLLNEL